MSHDAKMAEHLCTRLCHDLTGPIGAVNNGTEFLAEQGFDMQNEAMELIGSSAQEAVSRLQFFRQAYGKLNDFGEASLQEKKQLTQEFFSGSKIALDWPDNHTDAAGVSVSQKMARLLLNMIVIASATLIRGGTISVRVTSEDDGTRLLSVTAVGDTVKSDEETAKILSGDRTIQLSPKTVQAYLTRMLAEEMGTDLAYQVDADSCVMTAKRTEVDVEAAAV